MKYLSRVHIDELQFLVGDMISLIAIKKYQVSLHLDNSVITIYSEIQYINKNNKTSKLQTAGDKSCCAFTETLGKTIEFIEFQRPSYLVLTFGDRTRLKILGDGSGY